MDEKELVLAMVDLCQDSMKFHYGQAETYIPDSDMCRYHEIKAECYSQILAFIRHWFS